MADGLQAVALFAHAEISAGISCSQICVSALIDYPDEQEAAKVAIASSHWQAILQNEQLPFNSVSATLINLVGAQ